MDGIVLSNAQPRPTPPPSPTESVPSPAVSAGDTGTPAVTTPTAGGSVNIYSWLPFTQEGLTAAGLTGVVKDTTGAVLPGVAIEASSPALIEKVRTAVTDGQGRFNITDLRPGTYTEIVFVDFVMTSELAT